MKDDIRKAAADWVVKKEMGLSAHQQDEFNTWLTDDAQNKEAFMSASRSWDELDRLLGLQTSYSAKADPDLFDEKVDSSWKNFFRKRWIQTGACFAAAILILLSLGPIISISFDRGQHDRLNTDSVTFSRVNQIVLEDGSTVIPNHGASVEAHYSDKQRLVKLTKGEAIFKVTKDKSRPFIVEVSGVRVRAVGTVFNINFKGDQVDVLVAEGIVSVEVEDGGEKPPIQHLIEVNNQAKISLQSGAPTIHVQQLEQQLVDEAIIWKPTLIQFDNAPLSQIVKEFNRRNKQQLVLKGEGFDDMLLTSYFWSDNVGGFVRLLEKKYGIEIVNVEGDVCYLSNAL